MLNRKKDIDLYWFSGTGNSLLIARTLEEFLSDRGFGVNLKALEKSDPSMVNLNKTLGLVFPVAEQGTYPIVWDFIRQLPSPEEQGLQNADVFMVDTMAAYSGGVKGPIKKILKAKGFNPLGAKEIRMPSNLMQRRERPEKKKIKIEKGLHKAEIFAEKLISGKALWRDIPVYSDLMSRISKSENSWNLFRRMFPLKVDNSICTRCRLCETNCPTNSWSFNKEENRMIWKKDECIYCLRCFSYCPVHAISYGKKKYFQNRGVSSGEINKSLNP